jgi:hypothetical protein
MRRFIVLAALLGLTACGGEVLTEEAQAPGSTQQAVPTQVAAPTEAEVNAEALCSNSWECYCASFKTQDACRTSSRCIWWNSRCQPTYE